MIPSFDQYFMTMAYLASMRSKDLSTHIGAVIVGTDNEVISLGYNSFPRGIVDTVDERQNRPEKYFWMEHAERNAIYNAKCDLRGYKLYTQGIPCADCCRAIIQTGIKEVIVHTEWERDAWNEKWEESANRSKQMFDEAGVSLRHWSGDVLNILGLRNGDPVDYQEESK